MALTHAIPSPDADYSDVADLHAALPHGRQVIVDRRRFADRRTAIDQLSREAAERPGDAVAHYRLAEALAQDGDADGAIDALTLARTLRPHLGLTMRLGEVLAGAGRPDEARALLETVPRTLPPPVAARLGYAYCAAAEALATRGARAESLACFAAAAAAAPRLLEPQVRPLLTQRLWALQDELLPTIEAADSGGATCHGALVIWGEAYARTFCAFALPSLLAPGNLPYLAARERLRLFVYCDAAARRVIEDAATYPALRARAEITMVEIPAALVDALGDARWHANARYRNNLMLSTVHHRFAAWLAARTGASLLYLVPDWVLSESALAEAYRAAARGAAHVVFPIPVLHDAPVHAAVAAAAGAGRPPSVAIPAATLAGLAVAHLHPSWTQFEVDARGECQARQFPMALLWRYGETGLILHYYYRSSVYVTPRALRDYDGAWFWTLDHRLLDTLMADEADWAEVARMDDTTRALIVAVDPGDHRASWAEGAPSQWTPQRMAATARAAGDSADLTWTNHRLFCAPVVFGAERDPAGFAAASARARACVGAIAEMTGDVGLGRL